LNRIVINNKKEVNLLQNISLSIFPKEFVVVAGVSGGGKSTLLNALNGFTPASSGKVLINGVDLYKNFNAFRSEIGYVPQQDIIHKSLTVKQTLNYAAKLRMSLDTTPQEREKRVAEVLQDLDLTGRQNVAVERLSGGQLKRVSMGVELLTKPSLFFLDEATSGLDPGTEADMMKLLRQVADDGRTVLLITHATENVMLCDLVVFLAKGGYLAFYGSPTEALTHFGVQKFNQIYSLVYQTKSPEEWQNIYLKSSYHKTYILERQQTIPNQSNKNVQTGQTVNNPKSANTLINIETIKAGFQQFYVLFRRNLDLWKTDKISFWLTLSVAPLLGSLDFILWKRDLFDIKIGSGQQSIMMLFITAIIAIMVGSLSSMREIVKERDIYRRERMVGLQIIPYISSKVALGILISLYQAAIFLLFKYASISWTDGGAILFDLYLTLALTTIGGMVMGLLVSAVSPNQNFAQLLIILFLIPQITFGTGILPISALGEPAKLISNITISKWSFESMMTIAGIGKDLAGDQCLFDYSEPDRKNLESTKKERDCSCLGKNLFKKCQFPGIQDKYVTEVDINEPQKPEDPGDFPSNLRRLESYKSRVNKYKEDVNLWQDEYSTWKGKRESAIGEAEGIINKFYLDYAGAFNVDLANHWLKLGLIIVVMLGLILVIMKYFSFI
ncbi:MAG TPA: ATP-binding cassette domain-containing protein, partial [Allocoleopsis sp.]